MAYKRAVVSEIQKRISEQRSFIQILIGARQTGKTTAVNQALEEVSLPVHYVEAVKGESTADWLRAHWFIARQLISGENKSALLVVDEVQYVPLWSSIVKSLWDEDARSDIDLRVLLTGSSASLIYEGLHESLAGRFELIHSPHWSYRECRDAFDYSLEEFLFFGGYPGAAKLRDKTQRWVRYINNSIIEPSISLDILQQADIRNPELLRKLFEVGAPYSGQEISYRKLLGQLDSRGSVETIAHYLTLLEKAGLMSGLEKFDSKLLRTKSSSPRLMVHNTALMTASYGRKRKELLEKPELRGRLVESAVGAYFINRSIEEGFDVNWWRENSDEVDFVLSDGESVTAVEVKSGRVKTTSGMTRFILENQGAKRLVVGSPECELESLLLGEIDLFN